MGCGTSRSVLTMDIPPEKNVFKDESDANDVDTDGLTSPEVLDPKLKSSNDNSSEKTDYMKGSVLIRNREPNKCIISSPPLRRSNGCENSNGADLQERINVLAARRRAKSESDKTRTVHVNGNSQPDAFPNGLSENRHRKSAPEIPLDCTPRIKPVFPRCPEADASSPFGQRSRLKLTDSQREFFIMLDEKIAQGKDYCSEDEKSISSLVSRRSAGKASYRRLLTPLHAR